MSCFGSSTQKDKQTKQIDKDLKSKNKQQQHKILLLGTGNSGKTTFCKQLTSKFGGSNPHFQSSNEEVILSLRDNVLSCVTKLVGQSKIRAAADGSSWPSDDLAKDIETLLGVTPDTMTSAHCDLILKLSKDKYYEETLNNNGDQINLPGGSDGYLYFLKNIHNYVDPTYNHTPEDLLRNRIKTTGIVESKFECGGVEFVICDVAGQRSERRKWIHCFNAVSAVIYLTSVNEYDVGLEEANHQNSFTDSIQQWKVISDLQCFKSTPFIVFFNKYDLLDEKLKKAPLSKVFRDYDLFIQQENKGASTDKDKAISYFEGVFNKNFGGEFVEYHVTCALDPDSCLKVFDSVQRSIIQRSLEASGLGL